MTSQQIRSALALGVGILTFAGMLVSMIHAVDRKLSDIDARIQKIESAVKTLNAAQPDEKFKDLVKQLLAEQESPAKSYAAKQMPRVHTFGSKPIEADASANTPTVKPP
jgi:redox-regulated HSP33 family molecular chaperone